MSPLWTHAIRSACAIAAPRTVIDIGCGPFRDESYALEILASLPPGGRYWGIDRDPEAIARHMSLTSGRAVCVYSSLDFRDLEVASRQDMAITKCFVCLDFDADLQDVLIAKIRDVASWWLFYDSFAHHDPTTMLHGLGEVSFIEERCEDNPPYTRCGLLRFHDGA